MNVGKILGLGTVFGLSTISIYRFVTSRVFDRNAVVSEPPSTSIIMCTLNEENFVRGALESLEDQNVRRKYPDKFELIVVDSHSEDNTVKIAEEFGAKVFQAPRGKLNSRHLGIGKAKGEVIVSVDADCFYPPPNWLNLILRHFRMPKVVGVVGPRLVDPEEGIFWTGLSVWWEFADVGPLVLGGMRMPGQSSAFRREVYYEVGGFNLSINQLDVHEMVREEEIKFAWKLRRVGRVVVDFQAPVFTSLRRFMFVGKGKGYREWTRQRLKGERF